MSETQISLLSLQSLKACEGNARKHSKKQISKIAASIKAFGFTQPILIDEQNTILAGHGRFEAAKLIGLSHVPCIVIEHLTHEQKRAYAIADNRLSDESSWDYQILAHELKAIKIADPKLDLSLTGFSLPNIEIILNRPITAQNTEKTKTIEERKIRRGHEDHLPPLDHEPRCRLGDLWQIGPHRVLCGDPSSLSHINFLMGGSKAAMVIVDPYVPNQILANGVEENFITYYRTLFSTYAEVSHNGSCHLIFSQWTEWQRIVEAAKPIYARSGMPADIIIWNKGVDDEGTLYRSGHRVIFAFKKATEDPDASSVISKPIRLLRSNVWSYQEITTLQPLIYEEEEYDVDQRPLTMLSDAISDLSKQGDIILDGFGWTGQTLAAAHMTGRRGFLCEEDPVFCEIILRRAEVCTGQSAILIARKPHDGMVSHSDASVKKAGVVL